MFIVLPMVFSLKVFEIARYELNMAYDDVTVQHISYYVTRTTHLREGQGKE